MKESITAAEIIAKANQLKSDIKELASVILQLCGSRMGIDEALKYAEKDSRLPVKILLQTHNEKRQELDTLLVTRFVEDIVPVQEGEQANES